MVRQLENKFVFFFQTKDTTEMIITEENIIGVSLVKLTMEINYGIFGG